jgi:hypothetical protein
LSSGTRLSSCGGKIIVLTGAQACPRGNDEIVFLLEGRLPSENLVVFLTFFHNVKKERTTEASGSLISSTGIEPGKRCTPTRINDRRK